MSLETVLPVTDEQKEKMLKKIGFTENDIEESLKTLKEWLKRQPHLPQNEHDEVLQKMIIVNKFSLERTKQKLDMFYIGRNLIPEFFVNWHPLHPDMQRIYKIATYLPLPKMTDDYGRVTIIRLMDSSVTSFDTTAFMKFILVSLEIRLYYDWCLFDHFLIDFSTCNFSHILMVTPTAVKRLFTFLQKINSDRIRGIHFLHATSYTNKLITLIKSLVKTKIADRIHVHSSYESLRKIIPEKVLPKEYGGSAKSLVDLHEEWTKFVVSQNSWILKRSEMKSNEKLRPGDPIDLNMFGIQGSFRQLNID